MRFAFAVLLLASCADAAPDAVASRGQAVVYGADDRREVFEHPSAVHRSVASSAIAVEMSENAIDEDNPESVRLSYSRTLGEAKDLCAGERFAEQLEPGTCSGTLIDEQHLLTAGHCVDEASDCDGSRVWVFGFRLTAPGVLAELNEQDVYRCTQVLAYRDDDADHAVVRLDRPVVGHEPVELRPEAAGLALGTPLTLIGHPNGIPMKIASGATVTWSDADNEWLQSPLDAFSGNSGSGVFDDAGRLVAILDGGETDYVDRGGCNVVNVLDTPADDGESLTYLAPALTAFCNEPGVDSPVCDCDGPCVEAPQGDRCESAEPITAIRQTLEGTLSGFTAASEGSCGGTGPERSWRFELAQPARVSFESSGFDTVLYLREGCGEELECHDDIDRDTNRGSRIERELGPGSYTIFLDAYDQDVGAFELRANFEPLGEGSDAGTSGADAGALDASSVDGAVSADGGSTMRPETDGCAAHPAKRTTGAAWFALFALAMARRRRAKA